MKRISSPNGFVNIRAISFGGETTPSTRYRLLQFIKPLASQGVFVEVVSSHNLRNLFDFLKFVYGNESRMNDFIWIQKKLFPTYWIWLIRSKNIIFDFDDAIWSSEREGRSIFTKWRVARKLNYTLKHSQLIIAGNSFLSDYAKKFNSNVVIFPTVLDIKNYPVKNHSEHDSLMLGWIGQSVNFKYLTRLQNVFKSLKSNNLDFKLLVIADQDFFIEGVKVINRRWSIDTEVSNLHDIDIGLMPLDCTVWTQGKCSFKAIQYMASGIPSIVSKVGANIDLIDHGKNGFLVDNDKDWIASIMLLAKDPCLRQKLGDSARNTIQQNYSMSGVLPYFVQVIKSKKDELSVS